MKEDVAKVLVAVFRHAPMRRGRMGQWKRKVLERSGVPRERARGEGMGSPFEVAKWIGAVIAHRPPYKAHLLGLNYADSPVRTLCGVTPPTCDYWPETEVTCRRCLRLLGKLQVPVQVGITDRGVPIWQMGDKVFILSSEGCVDLKKRDRERIRRWFVSRKLEGRYEDLRTAELVWDGTEWVPNPYRERRR
ncbi:MAG: hypothetical protein QXR87_04985 [Candidatus Hadarchaeales archaeon]